MNKYLSSLVALFFPKNCPGCGKKMHLNEIGLCIHCKASLPETDFYQIKDNLVKQRFVGRFHFEQAAACYYFQKSSIVQNIIHQFKYQHNEDAALFMGQQMGQLLKTAKYFSTPDVIIPVPLHPRKKEKRGYNQSELLGRGLSETWDIPVETHLLMRQSQTKTQTKLNAVQRWENVKNAFVLNKKYPSSFHHLLLIDDVITSGATMEACACELSKIGNVKISMIALAAAK